MKLFKMIFPVVSMGILIACSSGCGQNTGIENPKICGGSLAVSRVPAAPNETLIKATVLEVRPNASGTILRLYITESHATGRTNMAPPTEIEAGTNIQILDINVNDTVTAFVSLVGDECGSAWLVSSVVKMPNATTAGTPDTMTVIISGQSGTMTTSYTDGSYNAQDNLSPDLISYITASTNTRVYFHSGETYAQGATSLSINIEGITPQSYTLGSVNPRNYITYYVFDTQHQPFTGAFLSTSGTVTLSSIGNVGEKINGDFDAIFTDLTNTSETLRISGTFSVMRDN